VSNLAAVLTTAAALLAVMSVPAPVAGAANDKTTAQPNPRTTVQKARAMVLPGRLTLSAATPVLQVTTSPTASSWNGQMQPVKVTDVRGAAGRGWTLTATMTDLKNGSHTISKSLMTAKPSCAPAAAGSAPGISAGAPNQSFGSVVTLCSKNGQNGPAGSSGGIYTVSSALKLTLPTHPHRPPPGVYTAVLTLSLS
jgi:hypothetical protein